MNPKIKAPDYPLVTFTGKVHYLYNYWDIAEAFENLTMKVEATEGKDQVPVAFDMEWPYDKKTDISGKTALIQVCMNLDECFLFHLPLLRKLPATMCIFLKHPRVLLHGVNIKGDMNKLQNDFPVFNAELMLKKCVDLRDWYNEVSGFNCTMTWSLQSLGKHALGLCVNKSLRASSWNVIPLTEAQQQYAAIDVFIGQRIYNHILWMKRRHVEDLNEFFIINGKYLDDNGDLPGTDYLISEMEKKVRKHEASLDNIN